MRFAKRLDAVPPYLFAELERKIAQKRSEGVDVISLGIGDPDLPTPPVVVEALRESHSSNSSASSTLQISSAGPVSVARPSSSWT